MKGLCYCYVCGGCVKPGLEWVYVTHDIGSTGYRGIVGSVYVETPTTCPFCKTEMGVPQP